MTYEMRKVFPQLHDAEIKYTWGGYIAIHKTTCLMLGISIMIKGYFMPKVILGMA